MPLDSLKTLAIAFLDNGGGKNEKIEDSGKDCRLTQNNLKLLVN